MVCRVDSTSWSGVFIGFVQRREVLVEVRGNSLQSPAGADPGLQPGVGRSVNTSKTADVRSVGGQLAAVFTRGGSRENKKNGFIWNSHLK